MRYPTLIGKVFAAFAQDVAAIPSITLHAGNALDDYCTPCPFDATEDSITDNYMEKYHWGVAYLDPKSWRHYLPFLIKHTLADLSKGSLASSALLQSLRPPDRDPPRLASLSPDQEAVVVEVLEVIAFTDGSIDSEDACQVLQEWWHPNPLYRPAQK